MTDPYQLEDVAQYNQRSLKTLVRAIDLSVGQFSLILVRCNYGEVQREILQQLRQQSFVKIQELILPKSTKTLYTAIKAQIDGGRHPQHYFNTTALIVLGLETVANLDHLLTATNQVRDEFRKSFPFPLVLWINDRVLQKLARQAPDFNSWAGVPIHFALATDILIADLRQKTQQLFDNAFKVGSGQFLSNGAIFGFRYRLQLESALRDLQRRDAHFKLEPELEACKQFILGRDDYIRDRISDALECYHQSLNVWQQNNWVERQGVLLFHIGLCYYRQADLHPLESRRYWEQARDAFQQCLEVFEQGQRRDWVAKFIGQLGEVLRRLEAWDDLQSLAQKALTLHRSRGSSIQLAQDYGFLAEVALKGYGTPCPYHWARKANKLAQKALTILDRASESQPQHRGLYLLLLAQSQQYLNQPQAAINHLEDARKAGIHQYDPQLHIRILEVLRSLYFEQGQYREAFHIKREQRSIEQQYGFRAFIGAGRLQPQRQAINPALTQTDQQATLAQEITTSGRQHDVDRLIAKISRQDCKLIAIYGQSGVGKSSLVTAGLVPALKQQPICSRDALPIVLRVYTDWADELGKSFAKALEKIRRYTLPVTLNSETQLIEQLKKNEDLNLLTILIFDQFEEFFVDGTLFNKQNRQQFYEFLRQCLNIPFVKVIISLREDRLSCLLECNRLTNLDAINQNILDKNILYHLGNLSRQDTKKVIQSLTKRSQFPLEPALIDELVQDLAGELGEVRPIELQVVGTQLQTDKIVTLEQYHQLGPKAKLVKGFLEETVRDCGSENERLARRVLYLLTDDHSNRPLKTRTELTAGLLTDGLNVEPNQLDLVLELLVKSGLLVLWSFSTDFYQLVHDYLVPFIQQEKEAEFGKKLKKATDERQTFAEQLHRVRRWQTRAVVFAGTAYLLAIAAATFGLTAEFHRQRAKIAEANSKSEALLLRNDQLGALIAGVQAAKQIQSHRIPFSIQLAAQLAAQNNLKIETADRLQQTLSRVQEHNRLEKHGTSVLGVSFSPDGKRIASAGADNRIILWNPDGTVVRTLTDHRQPVTSVSFSPDSLTLASTSEDKTIKLWNRDGLTCKTLKGHQDIVFSASFSPDGQLVASGSADKTVKLWSKDGRLIKTLIGHQGTVFSVSFSPDGQMIASASADGTVKVWTRNGRLIKTLIGHQGTVFSVSFSPDGQTLASASADRTIKLWTKGGTLLKTLTGHSQPVFSTSFSPDGMTIASASADNTVKLWKPDGTLLETLMGHKNFVLSVSFSPDSKTVASASADNTVRLWNRDSAFHDALRGHDAQVTNVSFSPNNQLIASASADKTVKLWTRRGRLVQTLVGHSSEVWSVNFSPDSQTILTASRDNTVKLWKLDGTLLKTLIGHQGTVLSASFSPDGQMIASASADQTIKLWSRNGNLFKTLRSHNQAVNWVSFSPEGELIASASDDKTVKLWSRDGKLRKTLKGHKGSVNWVSFSPDGEFLASASDDKTVKLWSSDGMLLKTLKGHTGKVWSVGFSPDGNTIVSASDDNTVKLWDSNGILLYTKDYYSGPVFSVSFSPDGKTLASASDDNAVSLLNWNLNLNDLLDDLLVDGCDRLDDYLKTNPNVSSMDRQLCDGIKMQESGVRSHNFYRY
ncbi:MULTISPECIES: hypothetical protein [unclassified Coleofasciculus]|uniref:nSTAND1 domain-containing NTPase n=1 Tax=unclassified Coleofasciculus TaxID=2692782 RepID=UPI00187ECE75|nr:MULTISPECIES: hypothetical protein [unclassified Coleofasciculus]MBE9126586.1 hypothetical protein [Coleofasciculus sp. LEGE 07081]MBE9149933.1 hypothetical protein [Coleofasciculus sp. LEGE 07092]